MIEPNVVNLNLSLSVAGYRWESRIWRVGGKDKGRKLHDRSCFLPQLFHLEVDPLRSLLDGVPPRFVPDGKTNLTSHHFPLAPALITEFIVGSGPENVQDLFPSQNRSISPSTARKISSLKSLSWEVDDGFVLFEIWAILCERREEGKVVDKVFDGVVIKSSVVQLVFSTQMLLNFVSNCWE